MAETTKTPDLNDVKKDIEELRTDLAALGKNMKEFIKEDGSRRAASTVHQLQERAESAFASAAEQGREAVRSAESTVKARPVESLLVAFGVGVLLGNIIRR